MTRLQLSLLALGLDLGPAGADGIFGPATEQAVRSFQSRVGISPTGVVDARTENALKLKLIALAADRPIRGFSVDRQIAQKLANFVAGPKPGAQVTQSGVITQEPEAPGSYTNILQSPKARRLFRSPAFWVALVGGGSVIGLGVWSLSRGGSESAFAGALRLLEGSAPFEDGDEDDEMEDEDGVIEGTAEEIDDVPDDVPIEIEPPDPELPSVLEMA